MGSELTWNKAYGNTDGQLNGHEYKLGQLSLDDVD
jgi:hypothetical protein